MRIVSIPDLRLDCWSEDALGGLGVVGRLGCNVRMRVHTEVQVRTRAWVLHFWKRHQPPCFLALILQGFSTLIGCESWMIRTLEPPRGHCTHKLYKCSNRYAFGRKTRMGTRSDSVRSTHCCLIICRRDQRLLNPFISLSLY